MDSKATAPTPLTSEALGSPAAGPSHDRGPKLLVVIPCLNEEMTVQAVVEGVPARIEGVGSLEILVMDDGSTDATAERARAAGARVVSHPTNRGLGITFQEAVALAIDRGADIMVHIDGDGQFDPRDIPLVVRPVAEGRADMVTASRFLDRDLVPKMPWVKKLGNRAVARIVQLLTGKCFRDVSCGFRAFSREALLRMNLFGSFTYTQECFLDLVFKGMSILEVPVKVRGTREFGRSRIASSLSRYALRTMRIMLGAFISYRPFSFFAVLAGAFALFGTLLLGFLAVHYIRTGGFSPHIWAGFVGGSFAFLGLLTLVVGLIGDMLVRIRLNQEQMFYTLKKADIRGVGHRDGPLEPR